MVLAPAPRLRRLNGARRGRLPPLETLYDTRPIDWPDMGVTAADAIGLIVVLELEKAIRVGLFGAARA